MAAGVETAKLVASVAGGGIAKEEAKKNRKKDNPSATEESGDVELESPSGKKIKAGTWTRTWTWTLMGALDNALRQFRRSSHLISLVEDLPKTRIISIWLVGLTTIQYNWDCRGSCATYTALRPRIGGMGQPLVRLRQAVPMLCLHISMNRSIPLYNQGIL